MTHIAKTRLRQVNSCSVAKGPVVYWMSRDQRVSDNWALLYAQQQAIQRNEPLVVVFCLLNTFLGAGDRQYRFMLAGLRETAHSLKEKNIPFCILHGDPSEEIARFLSQIHAGIIVADFSPLTVARRWKKRVSDAVSIPFIEVDAHNIVPCWVASAKQEFGAYTIRPKLQAVLPDYLTDYPHVIPHPITMTQTLTLNWQMLDAPTVDYSWKPGEAAAQKALHYFLQFGLPHYDQKRNNPVQSGQSDLSVYLHFGQLSAQRIALEVRKVTGHTAAKAAFLEELIIRRELSDNFCYYNDQYDTVAAFPDWAKKTLREHEQDPREYCYTLNKFAQAETHDDLWNAAQKQMVITGKMHGYMRMYWAKKILEWSRSPEQAVSFAITLNDRYELDGRDPNGYAGIAWAIGGVHDRAWPERPVFGKIRYMNYAGCKRKFNTAEYISQIAALESGEVSAINT